MAGLAPDFRHLRLDGSLETPDPAPGVTVEFSDDNDEDTPILDGGDNIIRIEHGDGSVTVSLDGRPIGDKKHETKGGWFGNLVDQIDDSSLGQIADSLLRGVDDDKSSRKSWEENRAAGIRLLGISLELPGFNGSTADTSPVEGISRIRHPLLLEAVLRFQANARSELLPTDGPMKIRQDATKGTTNGDVTANYLQKDMNHFLTSVATEYYPDTDRMFFMLGFGGTSFKKVYYCPLRNRPVSESVDANDLIVNNAATDLANARRITHRSYVKPSTIRRLQLMGVYRDVSLPTPSYTSNDAVKQEENAQQGISDQSMNPDDNNYELYEIYCELDVPGFEHKMDGQVTGLELPYAVTIDTTSRQVLSIRRNWDEHDELMMARAYFVKYSFVPAMGFYDVGLLHILGNSTAAVTAAWREMLDAGMYSSFPGFLVSDIGSRQNTNVFRVPPGGSAQIKTGGMPINQAVMPLPYKEPSQALFLLASEIAQTGARVGGTAEAQVGEGKEEAPVGTTLALIEQATKVINAVHKRMHMAQCQEFALLLRTFREHPQSFWKHNKRPAFKWDEDTFLQALDDSDLVPQSDPNTSSQTQRLMKIVALKQLQSQSPTLYDPIKVDKLALTAIGFTDFDSLMASPEAQAKAPPELEAMQAKMKNEAIEAQAKMLEAQTGMEKVKAEANKPPSGLSPPEMNLKVKQLHMQEKQDNFQQQRAAIEDQNRDKDRQADLLIQSMRLQSEEAREAEQRGHEKGLHHTDVAVDLIKHASDLANSSSTTGEQK
jgi:hypothetical protein